MDKQIKKEWVKALRSGKYKQTTGFLREKRSDLGVCYCCLGVLCSLYGKDTKKCANFNSGFLPPNVEKWAGLNSYDPLVSTKDGDKRLSALNDGGKSFTEIAELIENSDL